MKSDRIVVSAPNKLFVFVVSSVPEFGASHGLQLLWPERSSWNSDTRPLVNTTSFVNLPKWLGAWVRKGCPSLGTRGSASCSRIWLPLQNLPIAAHEYLKDCRNMSFRFQVTRPSKLSAQDEVLIQKRSISGEV